MVGTCALCGNVDELIDSHFMPAALYKELNDPDGPIKQMVVVTRNGSFQSGEQFSMPLLCRTCEIRFQQGGEHWTLANRYRSDGSFPIRNMLLTAPPETQRSDGSKIYQARQVSGLNLDQIIYFAASLFWRAAIADWRIRFADAPKIDLDSQVVSGLRDFLLGSGPFPARASIFVAVDENDVPFSAMWSPRKEGEGPELRYSLYIPGIIIELGVDLGPVPRSFSINEPIERIVLTDTVYKYVGGLGSSLAQSSEPKGSLRKYLASFSKEIP